MKRKQNFIFMTMALLFISAASFAGTVYSQGADTYELNDRFLKEQEQECVLKIKTVLKEYHCEESGVTMTKMIDRKGNRQYRVVIHHKKIKEMDSAKKEILKKDLEKIGFPRKNFSISYEFLL